MGCVQGMIKFPCVLYMSTPTQAFEAWPTYSVLLSIHVNFYCDQLLCVKYFSTQISLQKLFREYYYTMETFAMYNAYFQSLYSILRKNTKHTFIDTKEHNMGTEVVQSEK